MEWPKEAWFDYLGGRCTLRLANAVLGWSPGYFFACPHCGMALVVRHDATHHTLSIAPNGALTAKEPFNCPKHASGLVNARLRLARSGGGRPGTGLCVGHLQLKGDVGCAARFGVASPPASAAWPAVIHQCGASHPQ